jgi:hypothetical protein
MATHNPVIASGAKQSIVEESPWLDCFGAPRLAMTVTVRWQRTTPSLRALGKLPGEAIQ